MSDRSLNKYFERPAETEAFYGGKVAGYTEEGLPIVSDEQLLLTRKEQDLIQPVRDFRCGWFRLWVDADVAAYAEIMDRAANGHVRVVRRQLLEVPAAADRPDDGPRLKAWVEWLNLRGMVPPSLRQGGAR